MEALRYGQWIVLAILLGFSILFGLMGWKWKKGGEWKGASIVFLILTIASYLIMLRDSHTP